ncbi:hypothetical protein BGW38_001645 [Lunasporangiospora selenospora]|uniref:Yeast cell wall synthesis Kre9/Knh1-like N-terminal domain-containing protein n=1 Tax=Lunasporangiospora selenospora TaxID=979761 RepID=A0A9P6G168_9FUNG|nr:hypothetical protein BGW38_001645 [Lunasporangiospora selenospora]
MVTISWTDDHSSPLLSTKPVFDIFLMTGADDHQIKLATIASNVKGGSVSSVKYLVPYVAPPGQIYFLMFQTKDTKATAWATRFTITDATGNPGSLHPVIPEGGKINPGGVGVIVGTPGTGGHRTPHSPHLPGNPSTNPINQNNSNFKTLGKPVQQPGATGPGSSDSNVNGDANPGMAENNTNQNKKDYQFGPDEAALARTVPSTAANEHHGRLVMMGSILLALTLYFFV